ncbi:(2E,6E)-farnesyl diphosphate synthase [Buchnera aphidicola]|uniref:Ispa n=1 Tax=Buchnera aphidicola str. USDA (Myzus persicae) TaxID=1009856 RepID=W0P3B0_BUCMP|nr:(2E,6E)-farnesyl diphosphate synthase [Buchnera aphidicola]AHG59932.1 Ispa [Buchnera aphidicola str. USDA (Myzus persicae)]AHG60512.1 Ispa [Buchnera aphidicola str. W106 (Myzus persicae)]AHG61085.1 Ispa [Buchnera aphidicola str. G002 (Myzus persicae)]AHG61657.1 Ispa [Buchnera aphidicola str. F009 (Myzus persicae)]WAI03381.1 MAG: (2E,6E)-farnesyl diphosphate synthase [Buchnera aphidicola (Myzus persicae)]
MDFFSRYKVYQDRVNKKLSDTLNNLPFQESNLLKAMKYSIFSGGKRLRSCLVYTTGKIFKVNIITLDVISTAIECIHSYSLIHDDLPCMDNDDLRRGKPSCHIKYNENISLLAGDALQSLAFNVLSKDLMPGVSNFKRISMISELSNAIGASGMCIGQTLDLEAKIKEMNLSQLENINLYKTAFLIRSSTRLAYLSSNNFSKTILSILDIFSSSIGLAFQIQDDILDLKDIGFKKRKNQINNKYTYPSLTNIEKSKNRIKELYEKAFFALDSLKKKNFNTNALEKLTHFIIKRIE